MFYSCTFSPHAFDNLLFGISDREAAKMDPQQKWALECTYRAMENAGIPLERASGSDTAVFMGRLERANGSDTAVFMGRLEPASGSDTAVFMVG